MINDKTLKNYEIMKNEAIKRMEKLSLDQLVINNLKKYNKLYCSENGEIVEVSKSIKERILEFQKESGCLVYHIIHACIFGCETYELLQVSCYEEDWKFENEIMENGWVMVRSENETIPEYSESGSIRVQSLNGSLIRIN